MKQTLIECVPNFSEGNDRGIIKQITDQIESVDGVRLLDVDPGKATNRTVVTFVGAPEPVLEAAVRAARKASELIDMRRHRGAHPRFGALDVCPLVPVAGITLEETAVLARRLAERLGDEVGLTVYCYEHAASSPQRRNLADVRAGEYEGLRGKLGRPEWKPDFGPAIFHEKSGATAVGARGFLVAYNVNLNTTSTRRANAIAFDIREKGRPLREGDPLTGKIVRDAKGDPVNVPGSLKCVKAIGWYLKEHGVCQISINLTDLGVTPLHTAFDEVCAKAAERGIRVTGSELVGLIPLSAMLDAGRYFLRKQRRSTGVSDGELIKIAVKSLGLNDLYPFKPDEKIIDYAIADRSAARLVDLSVEAFVHETASESPAPGGGSVSAALGALGAALATMVANLSAHTRGWDERWEEFSEWAEKGQRLCDLFLGLIDEDTRAFNRLLSAFGLPQESAADKAARTHAVQEATREAMRVPLAVMRAATESMEVMSAMAREGNPNSASDAGVAALCARSAALGALLNVRINACALEDRAAAQAMVAEGESLEAKAVAWERRILEVVQAKL